MTRIVAQWIRDRHANGQRTSFDSLIDSGNIGPLIASTVLAFAAVTTASALPAAATSGPATSAARAAGSTAPA